MCTWLVWPAPQYRMCCSTEKWHNRQAFSLLGRLPGLRYLGQCPTVHRAPPPWQFTCAVKKAQPKCAVRVARDLVVPDSGETFGVRITKLAQGQAGFTAPRYYGFGVGPDFHMGAISTPNNLRHRRSAVWTDAIGSTAQLGAH